jgi:predicted ATP-grasp superfamily ATP-dependent carboligase
MHSRKIDASTKNPLASQPTTPDLNTPFSINHGGVIMPKKIIWIPRADQRVGTGSIKALLKGLTPEQRAEIEIRCIAPTKECFAYSINGLKFFLAESAQAERRILEEHNIGYLLPTTCRHAVELGSYDFRVMGCSPDVARIGYNKVETAKTFNKAGVPFAITIPFDQFLSRSNELSSCSKIIIKPGNTYTGSDREVKIIDRGECSWDQIDLSEYSFTGQHVVQPYFEGKELTIATFFDKQSHPISFLVLETERRQGHTVKATVTHDYDKMVQSELNKIKKAGMKFVGCVNLQPIANGTFLNFFEINARPSGTTWLRHLLGFQDVATLVREHVLHISPSTLDLDGSYVSEKTCYANRSTYTFEQFTPKPSSYPDLSSFDV